MIRYQRGAVGFQGCWVCIALVSIIVSVITFATTQAGSMPLLLLFGIVKIGLHSMSSFAVVWQIDCKYLHCLFQS